MSAARKLRTQRAWATYEDDGAFADAVAPRGFRFDYKPGGEGGEVPVLVVPAALATGCKHAGILYIGYHLSWCGDCGSWWNGTSWIRPRVLRAKREMAK